MPHSNPRPPPPYANDLAQSGVSLCDLYNPRRKQLHSQYGPPGIYSPIQDVTWTYM